MYYLVSVLDVKNSSLFVKYLTLPKGFWAPESLQMVTAVMKLKDTYSLEGKL